MPTDLPDHEGHTGGGRRDADLALAAAAGDREALGEIYDRYAPRVHSLALRLLRDREAAADVTQDTFLAAAQRLGGLREPEHLRAWLFAVARHEVVNQVRRASRAVVTDAVEDFETPVQTTEGFDRVRGEELRVLMADTSAGLDDRDRLVLELAYGEELSGAGMAAALGVREDNAHQLLSRARHRLRASLGALLVARQGRQACADLDRVLAAWDGTFSTVWRKRVVRHVDGCPSCRDLERSVLSPAALARAFPLVLLPSDLRERLLEQVDLVRSDASSAGVEPWGDDGFPPSAESDLAVLGTSPASPSGADPGSPTVVTAADVEPGTARVGRLAVAVGITLAVGISLAVGMAVALGIVQVTGPGTGPPPGEVRGPAVTEPGGDGLLAPQSGSSPGGVSSPDRIAIPVPTTPVTPTPVTPTPVTPTPVTVTPTPVTPTPVTPTPVTPGPETSGPSTPDPPAAALRLLVRPGGDESAVPLETAPRSTVTLTLGHTGDGPVDVAIDASAGLLVSPDSLVVPAGGPVTVQVRWRAEPAPGELTVRADGAPAVTVRIEPAEPRSATTAAGVSSIPR